ncbi:MAG: DUF3135 domain-containing protein [Candidatus Nitrosotenuis sp.]
MKSHEELVELLKDDEDAFNEYARTEIERLIESAPEHLKSRLRAIQFNLDMTLRKYKDPIARYNKMVELFWEAFFKFKDALDGKDPITKDESNVKSFRRAE